MADWFRWMKTLFQHEEEPEINSDIVIRGPVMEKPTPVVKHVQAKVSYQYPKGQFRFPLIPDETIREQRQQRSHNETREVRYRKKELAKSTIEKRNDPIPKKIKNQDKRPFRPTDVPSPVYGYQKRPQPQMAAALDAEEKLNFETEKPLIHNQDEEQYHPPIQETDQIWSKSISDSTQIARDDMMELEETPFNEWDDLTLGGSSSKVSFDPTPYEEDKDTSVPLPLVEEVQENGDSDSLNLMETQRDGGQADDVRSPVSGQPYTITEIKKESSSSIPFNVVMLKRDRQHLTEKEKQGTYAFPPLHLLDIPPKESDNDHEWLMEQKELLNHTLANFNVAATVTGLTKGPAVTRFEVHPEPGVKVNKITNLSDDIKLSLAAKDIRIEAPIPGTNKIGIEVPNRKSRAVFLREILRSSEFAKNESPLTAALGLDIAGRPVLTDLSKMPHGLIAGATGSGKSVCINSLLVSLLYKASPHEVKLMLIDPKMVELAPYNNIPHLVSPVITDVKAATAALKWAVDEMETRYESLAHAGVRDIKKYNELVREHDHKGHEMPYLVIVIDELADLMMVSPQDVEDSICRIAQKARACGIHLVLATQRPSVDVITGLIKSNIPTRIAFSVSSQVDSRTIIDTAGADKLLGRGDMLFLENGSSKPVRVQGNFVSDHEIDRVTEFVKKQMKPQFLFEPEDLMKKASLEQEEDDLFIEACQFVAEQGGASSSSLQRRFRIGFNRAARLIDMMEAQGIVSEQKGSKPRDVLVSKEQIESMMENDNLSL